MNHIATNLITKGNMNNSSLYKGVLLPFFKYTIRTRRLGGGSGYYEGDNINKLNKDFINIKNNKEDIDIINVYINWDKNKNKTNKNIYVKLIKSEIKAMLIPYNDNNDVDINVELLD